MSIWGRRVSVKMIGIAVAIVGLGAWAAAVTQTPDREITLVARGMAFYYLGDPVVPNPPIRLHAGERVRIVLRNDDRGITHDFSVPQFDASADLVDWNETGDVVIDVPDTPGRYEYICRPHRLMMRGEIVVVGEPIS
jgi:plastocyanin